MHMSHRVWDWEDDWYEGENNDGTKKGCFPRKSVHCALFCPTGCVVSGCVMSVVSL